jgi:hypothetical protein
MNSNFDTPLYIMLYQQMNLRKLYTVCEMAWYFTIVSEC